MPLGLVVAAAVVSGIALGVVSPVRPLDAIGLSIACSSIALVLDDVRARRAVIVASLFSVAVVDGAAARDRALASPLLTWFDTLAPDGRADAAIEVEGTLAADAAATDSGVRLVIDVRRVGAMALSGRVQAHVGGEYAEARAPAWTAGRVVRAPVILHRPQIWRNPGGPSERWQMLRRPSDLVGTIKSGALVTVSPASWWDEAAAVVRRYVRDVADRFVAPYSAQSGAIVAAILIGDRAGLADDVQRRLQMAGTYHVIAISGGNIAILTTVCLFVFRSAVRSARAGAIGTMMVVIAYGWLVGDDPSVRRAVLAACLYLGVGLVGLMPRALNVLAVVAMCVAATDPLTVIDVSAWLSFGATLGIIVCAGRFLRWTSSASPVVAPRTGRIGVAVRQLWLAMLGLLSATLAAEIALMPIAAAVFARVSVAGLVLNFVAIPAMAVVQVGGMITAALAGWWTGAARVAGLVTHWAAVLLVSSAGAVDIAPWLSWRVPPTWIGWTVIFYLSCAAVLRLRGRTWPRVSAAGAMAASLAVIVTAPGLGWARPAFGRLRVAMIDVGQGDALVVQFPTGHSLMVDTGGAGRSFDIGARIVTPAAWALGVRRLDWLAVTHADLDHIGGAASVARDLAPREIWEGVPVPPNPELRALRSAAHDRDIVWRQLQVGHSVEVGSVLLDVLNPPAPDWERQRVRNDDSIVLRLRFGDVEFLLTGDAGREFESRPEAGESRQPLRILKVGHHGSLSSSSWPFLRALDPQIALVSVGRGNLFGHPAPDVLARLDAIGAVVFRTDRDGAIVIETDGRDVDVRTMTGRRWTVSGERR